MTDTVRTVTNARWDCHGCGDCCRGYELGPVEPSVIADLTARGVAAAWPPAGQQPWHVERTLPDGTTRTVLAHIDGHCVFLRDDGRCAVHALYGAEAKPGFCRLYPLRLVVDPLGTVATIRASCPSAGKTASTPVRDHARRLVETIGPRGRQRFAPEVVPVLPDVGVDLDTWMAAEVSLLAQLDTLGDPGDALVRARDVLYDLVDRPVPTPDPQRARLAIGAVVEALARVMRTAATRPDPHGHAEREAFARRMAALLDAALPALGTPRPLAPDADAFLLEHIRSSLLIKEWTALGSVLDGVGALLVQVAVVRAVAAADPIDRDAAADVVVAWTRMVENPAVASVLKLARPALRDAAALSP